MTARVLRFFFFCAVLSIVLRTSAATPLQDGEQLTYRVSWAIVPGAGEITISAQQDTTANPARLIVTTKTATRKLARMLLKFDATAESVFDLTTGKLLSLHESSAQGEKKSDHRVGFDYGTREANYVSVENPDKSRKLAIPEGDPMDLIMGLLQTRTWDLKPGEKRDALVLFDDDFYELTIHMARYENVTTSMGKFRTVVLEPRMDKTPPKGMFKRGSSVRVWIAQDNHRLPVKFEVEFKLGTGTATLESYKGPSASVASDAQNPRP